MATGWVPPPRTGYLRTFSVSLLLVLLALALCLFAVRMEAVVPASGTVQARGQVEVRAPVPGLVEAGWYEGDVARPSGEAVRVRVDGRGDGCTDPARGPAQPVQGYKLPDGRAVAAAGLPHPKLPPAAPLWPPHPLPPPPPPPPPQPPPP